jgi:tetratricopeptide (TPR) repeat protein
MGRLRRAAAAAAVLITATTSSGVEAQPDSPPDTGYLGARTPLEIDDCPPPPDVSKERLERLPSELFERGTTLYQNGDFEGAIEDLVNAYCLSPYFRVLKSIGLAYYQDNNHEKAIAYYRRYLLTIPADVEVIDGIGVADEKLTMGARIKVIEANPAQIQVTTEPPGALITMVGDNGLTAKGPANAELIRVPAGTYTMSAELDGYEVGTKTVTVRIGKPYSYFFLLERLKSRLRIRTTPPDARILVNGRMVGQGLYDERLSRDSYEIQVEAPGRAPVIRKVELADTDLELPIDLPPPKDSGRWQLVVASGVAGASLGGVGLSAGSDNPLILGVGSFGAAAAAAAGSYFGIPEDIPAGQSSFIITTGLIGGGEALLITRLFTDDEELTSQITGLGVIAGATAAALTADRFDLSPGDAALMNTGALWGTVMGALFAASYDDSTTRGRRIGAALILTGLNVGTLGGILLGRNYEISRRHAALIDLAGIAGAASAAAIQGIIDSGEPGVPRERQANFAIAGVTAGLLIGAYLTRNMDAPKVPRLSPTIVPIQGQGGKSAVGFGIEGQF